MILLKKEIDLAACPVLYDRPFSRASLREDFEIRGGHWTVEDGWLVGENCGNFPGMILSRAAYHCNVALEFLCATVSPATHDINVMWNGSWDEESDTRGVAYVAGLQGWWHGKVGFEKSPAYKLNAATPLFPFVPGRVYRMQCGSVDGHAFIAVDGQLLLEVTDPDPIDFTRHGRIGFEAYCSRLRFRDLVVRQALYAPRQEEYLPEF